MKKHCPYNYEEADKHIVLNDGDTDLNPIYLTLPKPPPLHLIDGYGLPPDEQRFKRMEIPYRLIDLEAEAVERTKKELESNKNNVVTLLKIQKTFWRLLYDRSKEYKREIEFIRKVWWIRLNGYWCFIKGKPYYLTGWHFFFLNFYVMSAENEYNRPDYRDRDRREFIFSQYCYTTTETFEKLDDKGFAIQEPDGKYKMKDIGRRVCFGKMQPKNRRSGNTNKALSNGLEVITRTIKTDGAGIQSYSNKNAKSHFDEKLMPAFEGMPLWLKPNTTSGRTSDELVFNVGKNDYSEPSLQTKFVYATTASEKFFDGLKMVYMLTDESGKTSETNVATRHDVNKNCVSLGNGAKIFGFMDYPSTVSESADGAHAYRALSNTSNFYERIKATGQTKSGLFRLFIPADDGLEEFIDSYGFGLKNEIKDYQLKEGKTQTANEFIQGKFDSLIKSGDSDSMRLYREEKKLFPLKYEHCWIGEAGDLGFNVEKIDSRIAELRRGNDVMRVNFYWVDKFGGDVYYKEDPENGRFIMSMLPPDFAKNKKVQIMHFSTFEQKTVPMWRPMYPNMFTLGADPFRFGNKQDYKIGLSIGGGKTSRLSDGGIAVLWNYDESIDGGKIKDDWNSYKFVLSYRFRAANTDEYNEDVLKAAVFFNAMVYPETNAPTTYEYFIRHKFGGYLIYDKDKYSNKLKEKPGADSLERSKQELFSLWRDYVEYRIHKEQHEDIISELKNIRGIEQMRHFDLIAAGGMALMGSRSTYVNDLSRIENQDYDVGDFLY